MRSGRSSDGILQIMSVPIWIDPRQPEVLGTLTVGVEPRQPAGEPVQGADEQRDRVRRQRRASKPPRCRQSTWPALAPLLATARRESARSRWTAKSISAFAEPARPAGPNGQPIGIVLRSQTERLRFLRRCTRSSALTAVVAVLAATLVSYAIARTVTRPARRHHLHDAGDGGHRRPDAAHSVSPDARWEDEDARLLATTFNSMTDSIARFQREAAQRERLSSLGRLSTVVAHEIRNPLMIIKTSLRTLRREDARARAGPGGGQGHRRGDRAGSTASSRRCSTSPGRSSSSSAPADLNAPGAATPSAPPEAADGHGGIRARRSTRTIAADDVTDAERLRQALVNILGERRPGGRRKPAGRRPPDPAADAAAGRPPRGHHGHAITARGIAPEDLPRIFDPVLHDPAHRNRHRSCDLAQHRRRAWAARITVASERERGTDVRIELPARRYATA